MTEREEMDLAAATLVALISESHAGYNKHLSKRGSPPIDETTHLALQMNYLGPLLKPEAKMAVMEAVLDIDAVMERIHMAHTRDELGWS